MAVPSLTFSVEGAAAVPYAASPLMALRLRIMNTPAAEEVHAVLLTCQVRIDAERRGYAPGEKERLGDLFGEPAQWARSLRGLLWTHVNATAPPFRGDTHIELHLPCSADLSLAWSKYFYALEGGKIPLTLQFSGTAFYRSEAGLQITRIPWDREATFGLDVALWKEMMQVYYPNGAFLSLRADVFDRLYRYRIKNGLPTWEHALDRLLSRERES
jgi:hypothetical protein